MFTCASILTRSLYLLWIFISMSSLGVYSSAMLLPNIEFSTFVHIVHSYSTLLFYCCVVIQCVTVQQFIHAENGYLDCFQLLLFGVIV